MNNRVINISKLGLLGIRGLSVFGKFLFTVLYFQYSETAFGTYSLVATTIFLLVFLLGMDFYSYANRAVLESGVNIQKIIFNQFSLYIILYIVLFPLVYLIFYYENFDRQYLWIFYAVLVTEHLNTEFYRLLFVFKKPWAANFNLFLRNGLWVLVATLYIYKAKQIDVKQVLLLWLAGNLSALVFSLIIVWHKKHKIAINNFKWEVNWIKKGIIISTPYILATLAYKTIEFSDRYLIDWFLDKKAVGVYAFFANVSNVMNIVLFTIVVSVLYPALVEGVMKRDKSKFLQTYIRFKNEIVIYGVATGLLLSFVLPIILLYIDKSVYLQKFHVFLLLLGGNFLLNLSFLHHFVIYAFKKDWQIFKATGLAAVLNLVLNLLLIPVWGIAGAATATFFSFASLYLYKYQIDKKLQNDL